MVKQVALKVEHPKVSVVTELSFTLGRGYAVSDLLRAVANYFDDHPTDSVSDGGLIKWDDNRGWQLIISIDRRYS